MTNYLTQKHVTNTNTVVKNYLEEVINYIHNNAFINNNTITIGKIKVEINSSHRLYYPTTTILGRSIAIHHIAWYAYHGTPLKPGNIIDHINGNTHDNRKENLREISKSENAQNTKTRVDNKLGIKGVSYDPPTGRYRAEITVNKKTIRLGRFTTLEEAAKARKDAEIAHHRCYRVDKNVTTP